MFGYMKLSLKNLILKSKLSLTLLIMAQIFSVIVIVFSYGVVNHYNTKIDEVEGVSLRYRFTPERDREGNLLYTINMHQTRSFFNDILPLIENKLDYFFVSSMYDGRYVYSSTGYKNGKYTLSSQLLYKKGVEEGGSLFTEEEVARGDKCILMSADMDNGSEYFILGEEKYKVKGIFSDHIQINELFVPYGALPDGAKVHYISFWLKKPLLESEYKLIVEAVEKYMGDIIKIPEFDGVKNESQNRVYSDIIVVSVALIFVFGIDYCILYRYILEKRRRTFAVSRICGGSRLKISVTYMIELLGVSFVTFVAGIYIFHTFVLDKAVEWFEYIDIYCNMVAYKRLGIIYMTVLFVAYLMLVIRFVKKTPVILVKEVQIC